MEGACGSTITINADGTAHQTVPEEKNLGSVPANLLDPLVVEIEQADFEAILSQPFTDTCPIAFDGQQFTYTFSVGGESVKIDSCVVVVDPADPLFIAVDAAIASVSPA